MQKREPALDLLRCLALLLVVSFHSFLNNDYYSEAQRGTAMWLAGSFRWLSVCCIGLFLMLTGYLKSGKTEVGACHRGLIPVLLGYLLASAISIPIRHFWLGDVQTFSTWLQRLLRFSGVYYGWYVGMYMGLVLLSPFLNLLLERLDPRKLLLLAGTLLVLTGVPRALPWPIAPDYWRAAYPLTYYVLGAMVRRLQPRIPPMLGIAAALGMALLLGGATVLSTDGRLSDALTWEFGDLWIVLMVLCLFVSIYQIKISPALGRILAFGAEGCYGGYLLSHLLDAWCYRRAALWHSPGLYPKLFLFVTLPIFLCSVLGGWLLQRLMRGKGRTKCLCERSL